MLRELRDRAVDFWLTLDKYDAPGAAAAMAFDAFFSLVPLVALVGWTSHRVLRSDADVLASVLPLLPRAVARLTDAELMRLSASGEAVLAPLSAAGFLWLASTGVATAMKELERMSEAAPRPWLLRRALALGFVLAAIAVVAVGATIGLAAAWAGSAAASAAAVLLPLGALWLLVGGFFRMATARRPGAARSGFRGALVTLAAWIAVSLLFSLYVREIADYSHFYGGLAAVAVLLFWLWLMALGLLVGGEVNARLERARRVAP